MAIVMTPTKAGLPRNAVSLSMLSLHLGVMLGVHFGDVCNCVFDMRGHEGVVSSTVASLKWVGVDVLTNQRDYSLKWYRVEVYRIQCMDLPDQPPFCSTLQGPN